MLQKQHVVHRTHMFNKKTELFLKSEHAKTFIDILNHQPNGGQIIDNRGRNGIYFERRLALKFAAWLDPNFEVWVFSKIEEITFGFLKQYRDAMQAELHAKNKTASLKQNLIDYPSENTVKAYFDNIEAIKGFAKIKKKATNNQLSLFKEKIKEV